MLSEPWAGNTPFEFASAGRIRFGCGTSADLADEVAVFGERICVVVGSNPSRVEPLISLLGSVGPVEIVTVDGEPTVAMVEGAVERLKGFGPDVVVGIGGGAVLDTAKAIAALVPSGRPVIDHLEVVGRALALPRPALPVVALPTTSGTGSEVTRNAVITSTEHSQKVSIRDPSMLPRVAIVDPELTVSAPRSVTAASGLDALSQCIEPYLSCRANPLTDAMALMGMGAGARRIRAAWERGDDLDARQAMALCSLAGGLALANAKLGAVHGLAGPIGGLTGASHGAICGRLLPAVFSVNARAVTTRGEDRSMLERYENVARILTGDPRAGIDQGAGWLDELCADLDIPTLSAMGVNRDGIEDLCQRAARSSSMAGNSIVLSVDELVEIVERSL